jgi:hypothetical protein
MASGAFVDPALAQVCEESGERFDVRRRRRRDIELPHGVRVAVKVARMSEAIFG